MRPFMRANPREQAVSEERREVLLDQTFLFIQNFHGLLSVRQEVTFKSANWFC